MQLKQVIAGRENGYIRGNPAGYIPLLVTASLDIGYGCHANK